MANQTTDRSETTNAGLHPIFAGILAKIEAIPSDTERLAYEAALRAQDWRYEFSDDGSVYRRGRDALAKLREQQRRIDPSGTIWLSIAPRGRGVPQPHVEGGV